MGSNGQKVWIKKRKKGKKQVFLTSTFFVHSLKQPTRVKRVTEGVVELLCVLGDCLGNRK